MLTYPAEEREEARIVAHMLWGLSKYFHTCKRAGRFFTLGERDTVHRAGHTFLHMYSELRWRSEERASCMWGIVPKFHQYHHLVLDCFEDGYNPRFFHCFGDEDTVGKMITLAKASHASTVVFNTLTLYWIGLVRRLVSFAASPVV